MLFKMSQMAFCCGAVLLWLANSNVFAGQTIRVNVSSNGKQAYSGITKKEEFEQNAKISADGRYILFQSYATNLIDGKTLKPNVLRIFVRDRLLNKTTFEKELATPNGRILVNTYIDTPNNISANGRYLVFSDYVIGNGNHIFVRDRLTQHVEQVDVAKNGSPSNNQSTEPSFSADGRYVTFSSGASNLAPNDHYHSIDVFVRDLLTHKTELITKPLNKLSKNIMPMVPINYVSMQPTMSADGRYVAFLSNQNDLILGDTNGLDAFVHDRLTHKTERVSVSSSGKQGNQGFGLNDYVDISDDGRFVVFSSESTNLVTGDTNNAKDIFIHDRLTHKTERISADIIKGKRQIKAYSPSMSADGRYITFISVATNNKQDAYVYDRTTNRYEQISVKTNSIPGSTGNFVSHQVNISADGRYVQFDSGISNLVSKDTNGEIDTFVRDRLLDTKHHADLTITPTTKPATLKPNIQGTYLYTITNNGKDVVPDVSLIHLVSGGSSISFKPSQGKCSFSSVETVCHLGKLVAGKKLTLQVTVKEQSKELNQQVTVSGAPVDANPGNNQVSVTTPVK